MRTSQGLVSRSICYHILLIALAIQGITPDFSDIASRTLIRLFSTDQPDLSYDHEMDEVCVATGDETEVTSLIEGHALSSGTLTHEHPKHSFLPGRFPSLFARLAMKHHIDPIALCRLTC